MSDVWRLYVCPIGKACPRRNDVIYVCLSNSCGFKEKVFKENWPHVNKEKK